MTSVWSDEAGSLDHPLIALVHGSMDRSAGMLKLSRRLDERFCVLRYDRRGYARSRPSDAAHAGPFDIEAQVADLVGLLAGRPAVVVGHSYGGNVALAAATRHPDLVRGVAVYETPVSWQPWWPHRTAGGRAVEHRHEPEEAAEQFLRRMLGDERWSSLPAKVRASRRLEGAALVGELSNLRDTAPWHAADVHVPVVAACGSLAAEHHRVGMQLVAESIAGATFVLLDGCRHDAPLSHPDLFCAEVVEPLLVTVGPPWCSAAASSAASSSAARRTGSSAQ